MNLRRETHDKLRIEVLVIDGSVSSGECSVLAAGLKKLLSNPVDWALNFSNAQTTQPVSDELKQVVLDCTAKCSKNLWIIGPFPWAHLESQSELETLLSSPPLAEARLEEWFKQRTLELQERQQNLTQRLQSSQQSPIFELRRDQSRLERRIKQLEKELEDRKNSQPKPDASMNQLREKVLSTLENALSQMERR